jgi:hypothetical protein
MIGPETSKTERGSERPDMALSSFIKPPANGHHRWSGAGKKTHFYSFLYNFLQYWRGILQSEKKRNKKLRIYDGVD